LNITGNTSKATFTNVKSPRTNSTEISHNCAKDIYPRRLKGLRAMKLKRVKVERIRNIRNKKRAEASVKSRRISDQNGRRCKSTAAFLSAPNE
jgi:hypothetical protein